MAAPGSAMCPADVSMMSARGPPKDDVIIAFDDVSVDLVNIDQVNGSTYQRGQLGPRVSGAVSLVGGAHTSGRVREKGKRG